MVRFAGNRHARTYSFWLDVPAGAPPLSVRLFVKRVQASDAAAEALLSQLPDWVSPSVSVFLCIPFPRLVVASLAGVSPSVGAAAFGLLCALRWRILCCTSSGGMLARVAFC